MNILVKLLASGLFTGYVPKGSGTVASLLACGVWLFLSGHSYYFIVPLLVTVAGFFISGYAEKNLFGEPDSRKIVIDEIAGMLVTYLSFSFSLTMQGLVYGIAGFLFFRIFDIFKPGPLGMIQKIRGGPGIMLDDLASGALANGLLQLVRLFVFHR